ncbi:hypothetical protein AB0H17_27140 [Streptomyces olivoreticuli]
MLSGPPYYTTDECSNCHTTVLGIHGRWACPHCGECSPYTEPPEGWASEITEAERATNTIGYDDA